MAVYVKHNKMDKKLNFSLTLISLVLNAILFIWCLFAKDYEEALAWGCATIWNLRYFIENDLNSGK